MKKTMLFALAALAPLVLASAASAADDAPIATAETPTTASEVVVQAQIAYRNRSDQAAPVLDYGLDYFQRFEPLTAGDALKRVPSVTFLSDVLESDGARLRGLDAAYTQVLINGEKVPGGPVRRRRSFFVDRIPAELIERIEIVRSASANRSGDAVAGALNIVLRDAYSLDGGFVRAGASCSTTAASARPSAACGAARSAPAACWSAPICKAAAIPRKRLSWRYDKPGAPLNNIEVQTDVRNGTDYSFNASYQVPVAGGELSWTASMSTPTAAGRGLDRVQRRTPPQRRPVDDQRQQRRHPDRQLVGQRQVQARDAGRRNDRQAGLRVVQGRGVRVRERDRIPARRHPSRTATASPATSPRPSWKTTSSTPSSATSARWPPARTWSSASSTEEAAR
jgi:hypothetical protein